MKAAPRTVYLKDYRPPEYLVETVDLRFELEDSATRVSSRLAMRRNDAAENTTSRLVLDGQGLVLDRIKLNGETLDASSYVLDDESLQIHRVPDRFDLETETTLRPQDNTALEGLYKSHSIFCTQCEAEGFRRITWFPDRPDVMARYTTTIVANRDRYPVLLSNGNPVKRDDLGDGRHLIRWVDPFPKPSYLFALVAGDLSCIEDVYVTKSGRRVRLQIYVEHHNANKCDHAMAALKKAMKWDEEKFGREYDLDVYMIVAVDHFNMGAMENKGLNIFNSKYVLARPETATDSDFAAIESVIAHEYFHNWTGNRVTCRDWFQLSLKEGLTVFRDQEFSADTFSRAVKRIQDVRILRTYQFAEDAGPMAHPVQPNSYIEISNFYTVTVYDKGAEVIRMIHTLLGPQGFRRGMDLYFDRHDGEAVTIEEFIRAMEDANGADLSRFRLWYTQAGTPEIHSHASYDEEHRTYTLTLSQSCPPTPGQDEKLPLHIPLRTALLDGKDGNLVFSVDGLSESHDTDEVLLELREHQQTFRFKNVARRPILSLGRGYSAPVKLISDREPEELALRMSGETDEFNRWDAAQELILENIDALISKIQNGERAEPDKLLLDAVEATLRDRESDKFLVAETLTLPTEGYIADRMSLIDVEAIHEARTAIQRAIAQKFKPLLFETYTSHTSNEPYRFDPRSAGRRRLKNLCLGYLAALETEDVRELCMAQFESADNMSDAMASLAALTDCQCPEREQAFGAFERRWRDDSLVMDKWFALQAGS
ncbi:MAG: aminopeptidase N, partial [Gammaproteobacteria bacterium]|nr:aminopeptidase N [Gammaproteobacteria bacterium]